MIVKYNSSKKYDDEDKLLKSALRTSGSTAKKPVEHLAIKNKTGASSGAPSSSQKTGGKLTVIDKVNLANEKASRVYAQNAYDMSDNTPKPIGPTQWNGPTDTKNITFAPGTSISDRAAVAGERTSIAYQDAFKPTVKETKTNNNVIYPQQWDGGTSNVMPYTKSNNILPSAFDTMMQNAKNMEMPAAPTAVRNGTNLYDRTYNALSSIGDSRIGSDLSLKATAKQSVENEAEYRKFLNENSGIIDALILARDRYPVGSEEYKKYNSAIDKIYSGADSIRKTAADMTEANKFMENANTLREQATTGMGTVGKALAEAGMSATDNFITMSMTGFNPVASTVLMGINAGGQRMNELSNKGVSAADAFGRGTMSAVIEALTEKIGIDNLYDIVGSNNVKRLSSILKQAASEGTEEGLGSILNYAADRMSGDKESFDWDDFSQSVIQGFLSGFMFGVGGNVVNAVMPKASGYSDMEHLNMAKGLESRQYNGILPKAGEYMPYAGSTNVNIGGMSADDYLANAEYKGNQIIERMPTYKETARMPVANAADIAMPRMETARPYAKNQNLNLSEIANLTEADADTNIPLKRSSEQKKGNSESRFARSVQEQNIYDDTFKERAADNDNINTYDSITNEETMFDASELLNIGGAAETLRWYNVDNKSATAKDIAEGFILMKRYQDAGDYDSMINVAEKLRQMGTSAGQTVQAFSIMKRMTPEGMVRYAQKSLDKALDEMKSTKTQKWIENNADKFKLTADDAAFITDRMKQAAKLPDGREKTILLAEIQARIQDKIPPVDGQKARTLARISMLFNPKTQIRNILGNATVMPQALASDAVGNIIDSFISRKTGVRTTGGFNASALKEVPKGVAEAFSDYRMGINTKEVSGNKFEIGQGKSFSDNNILGKALNSVDSLTSFLLDAGDRGFYNMWYENSLKNQMKKNGVTEATQEMKDIAAMDALERTWQDDNGYTKAMSAVKNVFNKVNIKGYGLGDMIMPFVKTPSNLVKAVVDYSPAGVVTALTKDARELKKAVNSGQNVSAAQRRFVSDLSKGITGSLLMVLYGVLADKGIIRGERDDDKDVNNFEKYVMGLQPYSADIGGMTLSYEWAQPVGGSAAMMADAVNTYKSSKDKAEGSFNAIIDGVKAAGNTLFNLTVMQGLAEFFDGGDVVSGGVETLLGEPSKFVSSLLGQFAQLGDDTRRRTYVNGDYLQTVKNEVKSKIPVLRNSLEPVVDVLGRDVRNDNSFFNTFLNPANYYADNADDVANEIYSLYNITGDKSLIPPQAPYSVSYKGNDYRLTQEDITNYQRTTGKIIYDGVESLMNNPAYKNMSDEDKAEVYEDIYGYAQEMAKKDVIPGYKVSNTIEEARKAKSSGLTEADYYLYKYYFNIKDENGNKMSNEEKREQLESNPYLTVKQKNTLDDLLIDDGFYMPKEVNVDYSSHANVVLTQMSDSAQDKWEDIVANYGVTQNDLSDVFTEYQDIKKSGGSDFEKAVELYSYIDTAGFTNDMNSDLKDMFTYGNISASKVEKYNSVSSFIDPAEYANLDDYLDDVTWAKGVNGAKSKALKNATDDWIADYGLNLSNEERRKLYLSVGVGKTYAY